MTLFITNGVYHKWCLSQMVYLILTNYDSFQAMRKEYRGQRSVDAFTTFIRNEMKPSIKEFHTPDDFKPDVSVTLKRLNAF